VSWLQWLQAIGPPLTGLAALIVAGGSLWWGRERLEAKDDLIRTKDGVIQSKVAEVEAQKVMATQKDEIVRLKDTVIQAKDVALDTARQLSAKEMLGQLQAQRELLAAAAGRAEESEGTVNELRARLAAIGKVTEGLEVIAQPASAEATSVLLSVARVAEVYISDLEDGHGRGRYGSGYLVTHSHVLTAAHLIDSATSVQIDTRLIGQSDWTKARVIWHNHALDLALLEVTERDWSAPTDPVPRWGRVDGMAPVACTAVGFPERQARQQMRDTEQISGVIQPLTAMKSKRLIIQLQGVDYLGREGTTPWAGISGAAVFANGLLIGIITLHQGPNRLSATPVAAAMDDPGFTAVLEAAGVPTSLGVAVGR
jgi:hypothetical protein